MHARAGLVCAALTAAALIPQEGHAVRAAPTGSGFTVTTFAVGNATGCPGGGDASTTCYYNADSLTADAAHVYVGYQNNGAATGASGSSIVAQYAPTGGAPLRFFGPYAGKTDGLRVDPASGDLWVLNNEDANPVLRIVTPGTGATREYALPTPTPHSGGYDDVAFTAAGTFLSASNPGTNKNGTNTYRTVVTISFDGAGNPVINPVLQGQFVATDRSTGGQVKVTITDPDSLSIDPAGNVVLDGQGDSTLVFLPASQPDRASALFLQPAPTVNCGSPPAPPAAPCPPIVDETTWATSAGGHFLVADHARPGGVYSISGAFSAGDAYTTVSGDNPTLANTLGHLDTATGTITPLVTGFSAPKGLLFVP